MKFWLTPLALGAVVALSWLAFDRASFLHGGFLAVIAFCAAAGWLVSSAEGNDQGPDAGEGLDTAKKSQTNGPQ